MKIKKSHLKIIFNTSVFKSLYLNFKLLPLKQAIKLPIIVNRRTNFGSLSGKVIIDCKIRPGMIKFWDFHDDFMNKYSQRNILIIRGTIVFKGKADFGVGVTLNVAKNGIVEFGDKILIGGLVKIICEEKICLGKNSRISHESQVFDTNFHYYKDLNSGIISKRTAAIHIGDYTQIGNRSSVMKGTITNDNCYFGSNSLLNKDYRQIVPEYSLAGGIPAKLVKKGITRIWDYEKEYELNKKFNLEL